MAAYFLFEQASPKGDKQQFVFKLVAEDKIAEARTIIADTNSLKRHVQGTIVAAPAPYNPCWSYHLDPTSIGFFEMQIEVCDANASYVEDHLDEIGGSTLPRRFWCPWSSFIRAEVTSKINPDTELPTGSFE